MTSSKIGRRIVLSAALLALSPALALPAGSQAAKTPKPPKPPKMTLPHVITGNVTHVRGSTALLTGVILPKGIETSYYFQYGTTIAYGSQTPTLPAGNGTAKVKVGQAISGLKPGLTYDYRLVGITSSPTPVLGHNRTFIAGAGAGGGRLAFKLNTTSTADVFGSSFVISGTVTGTGSANQPISLQASPYPYLEPFVAVGAPATTNAAGAFSFRVSKLALSTQFRVVTLGKLPVYSPIINEHVAVDVTLHVSKTSRAGFVRFSGTVSPAKVGAQVLFQLQKATRPHGKSESTVKFVPVASAVLKRGSATYSRFSVVVEIRARGHYRAFVKLGKGALVSGASANVVIHTAIPGKGKGKGKGTGKKGKKK